MNNKFDEMNKSLRQSATRRAALKKFGLSLAGLALVAGALANVAQAQTSVVCDPAGDAVYGNGKGGPTLPLWLDITRAEAAADSNGNILFTMTLNGPIPLAPSWRGTDDGGQFWWGWRLFGDITRLTFVRNGCLHGQGYSEPAAYFVDLIWEVQTSTFHARLLDDAACVQTLIPFVFSPDRTQVTLVVAKSLFTNQDLVPDPNIFQYLLQTVVWKTGSTGNTAAQPVDEAPDPLNGQFVAGTWSASANTIYNCP